MKRSLRVLAAATLLACPLRAASAQEAPAAIAEKMSGVTDELNRKKTGAPVQTQQKTIVKDLDALIASLEKEMNRNNGGMRNNRPRVGAEDSTIGSGTGGMGTLLNPNETAKDWGKLSGRERDRILQSMSEGFPPEYRTVLERYYRRLADDKSTAPPGTAAPAPAPAAGAKSDDAKAEKVLDPAMKTP